MAGEGLPSRIRRAAGRWWPWVVGSLLSLQLFYTDFLHSNHGWIDGKAFWGRDFVILWGGGDFLRSGGALAIYDVHAFRAHVATLFGPLSPHNYLYPPVSFPIASLFSMIPYGMALVLWLAGTGALFVWAARSWWPREWHSPWLALLTPAAMMNIWAGHYGFLLGALFLIGWQRLGERRELESGGWFGLMLIKPHLAILVPIVLLLRRQWRAILAGVATGTALMLATAIAYGAEPWRNWFVQGGGKWTLLDAGGSFYGFMSTSTATAVLRLSDDLTLALSAQAGLAAAATAALMLAAIRRTPIPDLAMLTATATFLALPYAFNYDLMVVTIGALRLWADPESTRAHRVAAILGFIAPQIGMLVAPLGWPLTPLMLAALFAGQLDLALRRSAGRAAPAAAAEARST
ncbi:MAG TPA: glycosyltransferase family 87 protein [Sphingomicrobium sp.]|nr:glycosyltransferase family 87 protein [Sphingomicrobium sp.]